MAESERTKSRKRAKYFYEALINEDDDSDESISSVPTSYAPGTSSTLGLMSCAQNEDVIESGTDDSEERYLSSGNDCPYSSDAEDNTAWTCVVPDLRKWVVSNNVTQSSVTKLLRIIGICIPNLPTDARSLMKCCPVVLKEASFSNGNFSYMGLRYALESSLRGCDLSKVNSLRLYFNVDGLPICKSNYLQFWSILVKPLSHEKPAAVAIFKGTSKPDVDLFFSDFVEDISGLIRYGFVFEESTYTVEVVGFSCDTPARSYIKCVKPFNAYYGCDFCVQEGSFEGRIVFNEMSSALRTDEQFHSYDEHIIRASPLTRIPGIKMISNFPIDYMHLVTLGVVRKLVNLWLSGPLNVRSVVEIISDRLVTMATYFPSDFVRKPTYRRK